MSVSNAYGENSLNRERWGNIRFRASLVEAAGQAVIASDLSGNIVYWNRAAEKMYGWSSEEVVGRSAGDILISHDLREEAGKILAELSRGDSWSGEFMVRHRNGKPLQVLASSTPIHGRDGAIIGLVGVSTDITERKRMEEALQESEERFRKLYDASFEGFLIHDGETVLDINRTLADMLGYEKEELLGKPLSALATLEFIRAAREHFLSGSEEVYECDAIRKDGRRLHMEVRGRNINYQGCQASLAGFRTITERKRAEDALRKSEDLAQHQLAELQTIYDTAPVGLAFMDRALRFVHINERLAELNGFSVEEHIGKTLHEVLPSEIADRIETLQSRIIETGEPVTDLELRGETRARPGETRDWLVSFHPVKNGVGEILGINVIVQEVTERKRATERLRILAEASHSFAEAGTEYQPLLDTIARTVAENFGHLCGISILSEDGQTMGPGAYHHPDPEVRAGLQEIVGAPWGVGEGLTGRAVQTGESIFLPEITQEQLYARVQPERRPYLGRIGIHGVIIVPLRFRGEARGALVLARTRSEEPYTEEDLSLAEDLAGRAGLAIENALSYQEAGRELAERRRAEWALAESERRLREVLDGVQVFIGMLNPDGTIVEGNRYAWEATSLTREEVLGKHFAELYGWSYSTEVQEQVREAVSRATRGEPSRFDVQVRVAENQFITVDFSLVPLFDDEGKIKYLIPSGTDITERKVLEEQLAHQAFHDALTGLPNRALFAARLNYALARTDRRHSEVAVLFADLDNFKAVNDSFGHEWGDQLLVAVAERLESCLRPEDTLARFGGDEFIILLEEIEHPTDAGRVAERIAEMLHKPFSLEGREVFVSASIGISFGDFADVSTDEMIRKADTAMYQAKRRGSGGYAMFEPPMRTRVLRRMEMENDLRRAVEQQQFRLHYQPLVDLASGRIKGVEALVRWEHPKHGLISPGEFIPITEETGLIISMGRWVLEEACRQASALQSEFASSLTMSVNLSLSQFHNPDLVEEVRGALLRVDLEPASLSLEITESVAMREPEHAAAILRELKELGVRLVIDDFGTGHSSLSYLIRRFRMDILKIDRSFIRELATDSEYEKIISGIIGLAQSLNLEVVAEGVEAAGQCELLRSVGCDAGQGFYFSKPLTSEALSSMLAEDPRW